MLQSPTILCFVRIRKFRSCHVVELNKKPLVIYACTDYAYGGIGTYIIYDTVIVVGIELTLCFLVCCNINILI